MNSRRNLYGYLLLGGVLAAGLLYAKEGSGMDGIAPDPNAAATASEYARLATFQLADPFPEDTTDRAMLPAEKAYKNITTLKGITAGELLSSMTFISNSLGVRCGFCHVQGDFASDDKPEKNTARAMINMTNEINTKHFSALTVTCNTCHQGRPQPGAVPTLAQGDWTRLDLADPRRLKQDSSGTTIEKVLDRYVAALGGAQAVGKVTTRVMKITQTQTGAPATTAEIYQKAPNMFRGTSVSSDPKRGTSVETFDGRTGWMMFGNRPVSKAGEMELEQIVRMAEFFPGADLRRAYTSVELIGKEHIGDRDVYVVSATRNDRTHDRLYFDAASGLLVRRYVLFNTVLGPIPFSTEYSDYREADGVSVPRTVKWSTPRESWTETVEQLRHNVAIADTMFGKPR